MTDEAEQVPPEGNIDKTVEVARIIFHVTTGLTVVEADGRRTMRYPGPAQASSDIDVENIAKPLAEALDGLVQDEAGKEFGIVQVRVQAGDSIELIAIVVATYLAVRQGVEVVETLQKVTEIGRRIVRAVMQARQMQFTSVHGRVEINPTMSAVGRTSSTVRNGSRTTGGGFTLAGPIGMRVLLLLIILNLLAVGAVLAVVLTR